MSTQASTNPAATLGYGVTPPLRRRVNFRLLGFIAIFGVLLGWPLYLYLDSTLSGGLKNRGDYYEVDLKAMSDFRFSQTDGTIDDVPKQWRELNGKTVVLEGEIAPTGQSASSVGNHFELVYSVQKCCMSGPPQVQHFVKVTVPPTADIGDMNGNVFRVKGKLKVDVTRDPDTGMVNGVYSVMAEGVSSVS